MRLVPLARLLVALLLGGTAGAQAVPRHVIYLHAKIVEDSGRRAVDPAFGMYEYDAILDSLRHAGFIVTSEQRPANASSGAWAARVAGQVDSLIAGGVAPDAITVMGFSKGGWIAILASSRVANPAVGYVLMGACGPWAFGSELHVQGRILSLYETSDTLGVSCAPMFAHASPGARTAEMSLRLGLGHGTFFQPRDAWLTPAVAWARGEAAIPPRR